MTKQGSGSNHDPLAISEAWGHQADDQIEEAALISFEAALDTSWLRRGISREAFLSELLRDLDQRHLIPLLAILPRKWRHASAVLPDHLRGLGAVLEGGLISPLMLAALADDLQHLIPATEATQPSRRNALQRWSALTIQAGETPHLLPSSLEAWRRQAKQLSDSARGGNNSSSDARSGLRSLGAGLVWRNHGLTHRQTAESRWCNTLLAQVLNALGSNRLLTSTGCYGSRSAPFTFEGTTSPRELIARLSDRGWTCGARIRASVASFGMGASCPNDPKAEAGSAWNQVPLGVAYRTGLLRQGQELEALLPHCSFELELIPPDGTACTLLQYYQGTEGLNGWAAMNDLHRPWQNDRDNGTVAYPGQAIRAEQLLLALDLCDLMAAVHNTTACRGHLHSGGYGALGFCIDSTALLEQALTGRSHLFPLTLGGIWRERLKGQLDQLLQHGLNPGIGTDREDCVGRYQNALRALPSDLILQGDACAPALGRLVASQPRHSPFDLVRRLNGEESLTPPA